MSPADMTTLMDCASAIVMDKAPAHTPSPIMDAKNSANRDQTASIASPQEITALVTSSHCNTPDLGPYPDAPLNCRAFPHILDHVLMCSESWFSFRTTSRELKERVDNRLYNRIVYRQASDDEVIEAYGSNVGSHLRAHASLAMMTQLEGRRRLPGLKPYNNRVMPSRLNGKAGIGPFEHTSVLDVDFHRAMETGHSIPLASMSNLKTIRLIPPTTVEPMVMRFTDLSPTAQFNLVVLPHGNENASEGVESTAFSYLRAVTVLFNVMPRKIVFNVVCSAEFGPSSHPLLKKEHSLNQGFIQRTMWPSRSDAGHGSEMVLRFVPVSASTDSRYEYRSSLMVTSNLWMELFGDIAQFLLTFRSPVKLVGLPPNVDFYRLAAGHTVEGTFVTGQDLVTATIEWILDDWVHDIRVHGSVTRARADAALARLQFLTFDEYAATLSPEELELETKTYF